MFKSQFYIDSLMVESSQRRLWRPRRGAARWRWVQIQQVFSRFSTFQDFPMKDFTHLRTASRNFSRQMWMFHDVSSTPDFTRRWGRTFGTAWWAARRETSRGHLDFHSSWRLKHHWNMIKLVDLARFWSTRFLDKAVIQQKVRSHRRIFSFRFSQRFVLRSAHLRSCILEFFWTCNGYPLVN